MVITILTDDIQSWFVPYGMRLKSELELLGHNVYYVFNKNEIQEGDVCFLLSCSRIVENQFLRKNKNNIVVHASDLPKGRGFSPLQWQILEGKNEIVLTVIEAVDEVDAGPYYLKEKVTYDGSELLVEMRERLGNKIIGLCKYFINNKDTLKPIEQVGESTFFRRRTRKDDEIDPNKTIVELFNQLRIADNEKYPLWFTLKDNIYYLKIYKKKK